MRTVDADELLKSVRESAKRAEEWLADCKAYHSAMTGRAEQAILTFNECALRIKNAPTVDAVEVVRCRVCRWWGVFPGSTAAPTYHDCKARGISTDADDFCKRGERKDGDNHDG